jgi:hypothetical protein
MKISAKKRVVVDYEYDLKWENVCHKKGWTSTVLIY